MYNFLRRRGTGYTSMTRFPNIFYEEMMHRPNARTNELNSTALIVTFTSTLSHSMLNNINLYFSDAKHI
jgi:hypothetical protein